MEFTPNMCATGQSRRRRCSESRGEVSATASTGLETSAAGEGMHDFGDGQPSIRSGDSSICTHRLGPARVDTSSFTARRCRPKSTAPHDT